MEEVASNGTGVWVSPLAEALWVRVPARPGGQEGGSWGSRSGSLAVELSWSELSLVLKGMSDSVALEALWEK